MGKNLSTQPQVDNSAQFAIAQYNTLRNEVIKRSELRFQLTSLTLIIVGTFLTFGLQPSSPGYVLFVFPILGCFLTGIWTHNVLVSRQITAFIIEHIESKFKGIWWDMTPKSEDAPLLWLSGILSNSGIFLGTQIIFFILGLLKATFTTIEIVLIVFDVIAIMATILMLYSAITSKPKQQASK